MRPYEILENIRHSYCTILGTKLVGFYIHGSLAMDCFRWEVSDIDFLTVVNAPLCQAEKEALIRVLLKLDPFSPPKGLEMSVVLDSVCHPFVYPTPFELHFSNGHKERCKENISLYCRTMNGTDIDLAAHFTVVQHYGQVLWGKPIEEVFAPVPRSAYWDSICNDIRDATDAITSQPAYYILNLCRVLAYWRKGLVLSKAQGGRWGLENLPRHASLIEAALAAYESSLPFHGAKEQLTAFAEAMLTEINQHGE